MLIKEDYEGALIKVQKSLELDSVNPLAHFLEGRILFEGKRYSEAQVACEKSIEQASFLPESHYLLGIIHKKLHMPEKAIEELRKAISLNEDLAMAHFHLADLLEGNKKSAAITEYKKTLEVCMNQPPDELVDFGGGFSCKLLIALCKKKIKQIEKTVPNT
jgi:tetratricopeptide (TPR) repeat protein